MKRILIPWMSCLILGLFIVLSGGGISRAQSSEASGWGIDEPYNLLYEIQDVDNIEAKILEIKEITPMPGMSKGVGMIVKDNDDDETYTVHICPLSYKTTRSIGFRKGDKIKLRGSFVEIDDEDVIMAAKIKKKGKTLKIRLTSNGKPFWAMSKEELLKELQDN